MGRRHDRKGQQPGSTGAFWETERTLADAEADESFKSDEGGDKAETRCICGGNRFLLEGYFEVTDGRIGAPVELQALTCPDCGREYEPIDTGDGRVLRGDFLGQVELEGDDDEGLE